MAQMARRTVSNLVCLCSSNEWIASSQTPSTRRGFSSTIFVSRLSSFTTEERLKKLFAPFGSIKEARLIKDQITERPKGFGFVEYQTEVEAHRALKAMNYKILDGRLIFVEMAKSRQNKVTS